MKKTKQAKSPRGLFVTGTGTGVGKTFVAAMIARQLVREGRIVGVYKPAASGCVGQGGEAGDGDVLSDDALALWRAAGEPGELAAVCPQRFRLPLAPHLAARAEGREIDSRLLREGLEYWRARSEIVIVEGAGGLMSPLGDEEYVADLALDFGYPLVVVAANELGTINATLQTLIAAATFREGLSVAGVVLNDARPQLDQSAASNEAELAARCFPPILARVAWMASDFDRAVDWHRLSRE